MLKIISSFGFLITLGLLLGDSIGFYSRSLKYFNLDSRVILIIFLFTQTILAFFDKQALFSVISKINKFIFPFLFGITIFSVLANYYLYATYSLDNYLIDGRNIMFVTLLIGSMIYLNYAKSKSFIEKLRLLLPPILVILVVWLVQFNPDFFYLLDKEDGIFEYIQFFGYLMSAVLAFLISKKLSAKRYKTYAILFLILSLFLFFISGEEISWGQRILNIQTPEYIAKNNFQQEITVHNNKNVQPKTYFLYMLTGLIGAFGFFLIRLFPKKLAQEINILVPHPKLFFYFFAPFAYFFFSLYLSSYYGLFNFQLTELDPYQELAEMFLALGFLQFTYSKLSMLK